MQSTGAVDVFVDVAELGRVHAELCTLVGQLDSLDDMGVRPEMSELGSDQAADALAEFIRRWTDERRHLVDHLRACARYLEQAVQEYTSTEDSLTRALDLGPPVFPLGSAP